MPKSMQRTSVDFLCLGMASQQTFVAGIQLGRYLGEISKSRRDMKAHFPDTLVISFSLGLFYIVYFATLLNNRLFRRKSSKDFITSVKEIIESCSLTLILVLYSIAERSGTDFGIYRLRSWLFTLPILVSVGSEFVLPKLEMRRTIVLSTLGALSGMSSTLLTRAEAISSDQDTLRIFTILLFLASVFSILSTLSSTSRYNDYRFYTSFALFVIITTLDSLSFYSLK